MHTVEKDAPSTSGKTSTQDAPEWRGDVLVHSRTGIAVGHTPKKRAVIPPR